MHHSADVIKCFPRTIVLKLDEYIRSDHGLRERVKILKHFLMKVILADKVASIESSEWINMVLILEQNIKEPLDQFLCFG